MARPIILIKKELLEILAVKKMYGVPVCKLIKQHKMSITHPTLGKLIKYYDLLKLADNPQAHEIIIASLFPDWLELDTRKVQSQPREWQYIGVMPLGKWVENV